MRDNDPESSDPRQDQWGVVPYSEPRRWAIDAGVAEDVVPWCSAMDPEGTDNLSAWGDMVQLDVQLDGWEQASGSYGPWRGASRSRQNTNRYSSARWGVVQTQYRPWDSHRPENLTYAGQQEEQHEINGNSLIQYGNRPEQ